MPIATVIVHHGSPKVSIDCLKSLAKHCKHIVLVCNTSYVESKKLKEQMIASNIDSSHITIIEQEQNTGFATACNAGIRHCLTLANIKYIWLLNNDTIINQDTVKNLLNCLELNKKSIIGTAVLCMDKYEKSELILGCKFSPWTSICKPCQSEQDILNIDYVYGASFAFPIDLVTKIGFFDEQFFLYYEEHDYCLRAKNAGYFFVWCKEAKVWHKGGSSAGLHDKNITKRRKFSHYHETRSTFLFLKKHYPWAIPSALLIRTFAKLILLPLRGQWQLLPSYFKGIYRAFC